LAQDRTTLDYMGQENNLLISNEKEEKWNVITHALGIIFALATFPFLIFKVSNSSTNIALGGVLIYFASFLLLFFASTTYHAISNPKKKRMWRKIDHISIYFMISGTYVPFMIAYIPSQKAIVFLAIMYFLVLLGSVLKIFYTGKFEKASLLLYLFLGWMIVFMGKSFFTNSSTFVASMVMLGGLAYTSGIYFYTKDHRKYYHAIWHIFVLIGSILHFVAVYNI